jgi:hypothetical protein
MSKKEVSARLAGSVSLGGSVLPQLEMENAFVR